MKRFMYSIFVALVIGALASISLAANYQGRSKTENVIFTEDVMVNDTLLEAGEYRVRFDESAGELTVIKNGEVKAKALARVEARNRKARNTSVRTRVDGGVVKLIGVTFDGWTEDVVVVGGAMSGTE